MPFSFSTFGNVLSEFQKYLTERIPKTTIVPLGVVVLLLAAISGQALGWKEVDTSLQEMSASSKAVYLAAAVLGFVFLAYALSALQGVLSRLFQGHWPVWLAKFTGRIYKHNAEYETRRQTWRETLGLYEAVRTAYERVTKWGEGKPASSSVATIIRALPPYHVITDKDLLLKSVDKVPDGALQPSDAVGRMTLRPLADGASVTSEAVSSIPDPTWLNGMTMVPIALRKEAAPADLTAGDVVNIFLTNGVHRQPLNPGGSLIVNVQQVSRTEADETTLEFVGLTLAVPPEAVSEFLGRAAEARLSGVWRLPPESIGMWGSQPRTRRWVPRAENVSGISAPKPGDVIDLCLDLPGREPETIISEACFLEKVERGWILALRMEDTSRLHLLDGLDRVHLRAVYSMVNIPVFTETQEENAFPLMATLRPLGQVREGKLVWQGESITDVVKEPFEITGRYAMKEINGNEPIIRSKLGPPEKEGTQAIPVPQGLNLRDSDRKVHVVSRSEGNMAVAFNCEVLGVREGLIVPRELVGKLSKGDVQKQPAGAVPAGWRAWTDARAVSYTVATSNASLPSTGVAVGLVVRSESEQGNEGELFGGIGLVEDSSSVDASTMTLLVDRATTNLPPRGSILALMPYAQSGLLDEELKAFNVIVSGEELVRGLADEPTKELWKREVKPDDALQTVLQGALGTLVLLELIDQPGPEWDDLRQRADVLRERLRRVLEDALRQVEYRVDQERKQFRLYYPQDRAAVAPTSVGNVIRAVDFYAEDLYGLDAALVLPRLQAVMDKESLESLKSTQDRLELLQWSCVGAIVVGIAGTLIAAMMGGQPGIALVVWFSSFLVAWLLYRAVLQAALGYAEALKLAFDHERGKVLQWLGILVPDTVDQNYEKTLWSNVEQWWQYGAPSSTLSYTLKSQDSTSEKET